MPVDAEQAPILNNRPYAPPSNIISILQRLRERNPPNRIDNEYLRDIGISEGAIARVLFGLRFLGLIEEDSSPTDVLRSIGTSTDEDYKEILGALLRSAYSEVFERVDPARESQDRILNVFRRYTPASQRERMVTFFLGMCREAGMDIADAPRQRTSAVTSRSSSGKQSTKSIASPKRLTGPVSRNQSAGKSQDTDGVSPAILLLVRSLPPEGMPLSTSRRKQWLAMAEATLAFVYPEEPDGETSGGSVGEEDAE